jgi:hypothetical protein
MATEGCLQISSQDTPDVRASTVWPGWSAILLIVTLTVMACLSGCGYGNPVPNIAPEEPNAVSLNPTDWYIYYSAQMPEHPAADSAGGWSFEFPNSGGHVNYVQTPFNATKTLTSVSITFRVDSSSPQYQVLDPGDTPPATFRLFFEQRNDNLSEPNGRFWADSSIYNLGSEDGQTLTITVPLTFDHWTNVDGQGGDEQAFDTALKNIGWIGMTFGGQSFAGHGVAMTSGTAKYTLINYSVN